MPEIDVDEEQPSAGSTGGRPAPWAKALVASAAVLAILLLGAAVGLLIQLPGSGDTASPSADSVDVGFCQDMATHHRQAVEMSNIALQKSTDPALRQIAFDVESSQLEQVGRMKGWLSLWSQPEQSPGTTHMAWMAGAAGHAHGGASTGSTGVTTMPGIASQDELAKLRSLSGKDFDVYFLQLMIRHHEGGGPMARYAAEHAGVSVVRTLAENMLKSQSSEILTMTNMLVERGAQPLPPPA
ncbi:DUF305 domain-containing protein [Solihabitans fulvus]|uniref:DUF305 domain-containing protein n=1 Tax=Solihabitans fulvus TaxID=1892852 RepID=A0A5B2X809_9PSEU|nr:DUF305 domain-containing protein [Solihabitans fulvus]KAA2259414.1 DUF305 domain-containing protein [Solihabitans fulvus]